MTVCQKLPIEKQIEKQIGGKIYYECECGCGNSHISRADHLITGKSIQCKPCFVESVSKSNNYNWQGYEEISSRLFNMEFNIDIKYAWDMFVKQDKKCAITGVLLEMRKNCKDANATASLDRIDITKSYSVDNVQWVTKEINRMKLDLSEQEFLDWCNKVYEHSKAQK